MLSITLIIIILTALVSLQSFSNARMKERLIFHPYTIAREDQYYRFLTHGFIHANWEHLLINMYVLYIFGEFLEAAFKSIFPSPYGPLVFLFVYLTAIVVSSLPSYFKHREDPYYGALGASGATSAMVFGFILFNPWEWFLFPPLPAILFGLAYLWYSNYMGRRSMDNIGHDAHFWGALYGLVATLLSVYYLQPGVLRYFWDRLLEGPDLPGILGG